MLLNGKVALITGSASGIGRTGALSFAREGAKVVVADISEQGREVAEEIRQQGNEAAFVQADVRSLVDIKRMVGTAIEKYGRIDVFWHNAGISGQGGIDETTEEGYEKTMGVHLKAGVFGAQAVITEMRKHGRGCILFTSSIAGLKASPTGSVVYSLAKAGLVMLTKLLALSSARENIRVNCICPGPVDTPLLESIGQRLNMKPEEFREHVSADIPMGRYITVDELVQAALFLVSDRASGVTGIAFPVDGGWTAK
jgi:NAD(P)-dependent dehydrogenase (short-subunit alcohol dehydrogenase family)